MKNEYTPFLAAGCLAFIGISSASPILSIGGSLLARGAPDAHTRSILLVTQGEDAGWQDMAYLAAIPAATVANGGNPSAIALEAANSIPREVDDYLRRFKPTDVYHIANTSLHEKPGLGNLHELSVSSADDAAIALSVPFWKSSTRVVLCGEEDYASALMASTLAARLQVPLFFCGEQGVSKAAIKRIRELGAKELIFIGKAPADIQTTELVDAGAVLGWMQRQGLEIPYFALVNVRDRSGTTIPRISLAAPLLASLRKGMVIPFDYEVLWRVPFKGTELKAGVPTGQKAPRQGILEVPEGKVPFVLSYAATSDDGSRVRYTEEGVPVPIPGRTSAGPYLQLDLNSDGTFDGPDEGPFDRNFAATLFGKTYHLDFGGNRRHAASDLSVSSDHIELILGELHRLYAIAGIPHYLCIVGFPDAIPQGIRYRNTKDLTTDLPYANVDEDLFSEISVGRIIGESAAFATLHASRIATYAALRSPEWSDKAGQSSWEQTLGPLFENAGLDASAHQTVDDLEWIVPPSADKKGKRASSFGADSPLTHVGFIAHSDHSWWRGLGRSYDMNSTTLLAPAVVESGGCLTATLDYEPKFRSVISRLFRNGAVSFVGQTREGIAQQFPQRSEFWNQVLAGSSIGDAHRETQNVMAHIALEMKLPPTAKEHYQLQIRALFGDPAFTPISSPHMNTAPAQVKATGDRVSVYAPKKWTALLIGIPKDWKQWYGKPLYALRGSGAYSTSTWNHKMGRNVEGVYVNAEFTTRKKVESITQTQSLPEPLGWNGQYTVDENPDGSRTYRWRVRLVDFDQVSGTIINEVERVDFRIQTHP